MPPPQMQAGSRFPLYSSLVPRCGVPLQSLTRSTHEPGRTKRCSFSVENFVADTLTSRQRVMHLWAAFFEALYAPSVA